MNYRHTGSDPKKKLLIRWLLVILAFAAALAGIYWGVRLLDRDGDTQAFGSLEGRFQREPAVTYEGKNYYKNEKLTSFLLLGIDDAGDDGAQKADRYRSGGQCDFLMLLVIDNEHKVVRRIQIDRDTMAEITVLGILGNELGTNTMQICLAHGFGDGREQSCLYAVQAVERFLYGIKIDGYFSMNMDGITALNDLLGGVTVTIEDDFSAIDPAMTVGATLTLQGTQAETFVRGRMSVGDGTNESRMRRQKEYLLNAMELMSVKTKERAAFIGELFDGLKPYTVTDISRGRMVNEANKANKYASDGIVTPTGQHTVGEDGFVEFHADQDALMQLVLDVFYEME